VNRVKAAALLAVALLATVIVVFAHSSANGAPDGRTIAVTPATTNGRASPSGVECDTAKPTTYAGIVVSGACVAQLSGNFTCVAGETTSLSTSAPIDSKRTMYLTLVLPEDEETTAPFGAAYVQVTGGSTVPRWSNRRVTLDHTHNEWLGLNRVVLTAEPGTGATGTLMISGEGRCPEDG
jgi:hypothetical protein